MVTDPDRDCGEPVLTEDEALAFLAERVRLARRVRRDTEAQECFDRLCEQLLADEEGHLGMAVALLYNLRVMGQEGRALTALCRLHDELAPRALRGADPN